MASMGEQSARVKFEQAGIYMPYRSVCNNNTGNSPAGIQLSAAAESSTDLKVRKKMRKQLLDTILVQEKSAPKRQAGAI